MNQTPPISPVVKLKLKQLDEKKLRQNNALDKASSKLQSLLEREATSGKNVDKDALKVSSVSGSNSVVISASGTEPVKALSSSGNEDAASVSKKLSGLMSQLLDNDKNGPLLLSEESVSDMITILNATVNFIQNQENLLNLLKLNTGIVREQFLVEREMFLKELDALKTIREKQLKDLVRRRNSEPSRSRKNFMKTVGLNSSSTAMTPLSRSDLNRKLKPELDESDRTISDDEEIDDDTPGMGRLDRAAFTKMQRNQDYNKLIEEINKNQKLYLSNKFGYYHNTLNENRRHRKKRKLVAPVVEERK